MEAIILHSLIKTLNTYFGDGSRYGDIHIYNSPFGAFFVTAEDDHVMIKTAKKELKYNTKFYDAECIFRSALNAMKA
nr:hypothetical protein K-LCC10_0347 [Kaumoebavirus]